jgi:enediyne biosynthesis protein E4
MKQWRVLYLLTIISLLSCQQEKTRTRFELISSGKTNITFTNAIEETDELNILTYEYLYNGGGVGIIDVDNDGLQDIFFTGNQVPNALYRNKGNFAFEDISASSGIQLPGTWSTGVSIVDINADGYDDIFVCVGGPGNKSVFKNKLFINQHNLTFVESGHAYGLDQPAESVQAAFLDYDKDGDLDMYLLTGGGFERSAIAARPMLVNGESRNTDRLYQNNYDSALGHPVFTDVSREAGILMEGFGLGVAVVDANEDSWPDLYVSNDYISRDFLLINNRNNTFTDRSLALLGHTSHYSMGNDVGDINNDGHPDLITVDMLPDNHRRRKLMSGPNDYDRFQMAVGYQYGHQYMRNMLQVNRGDGSFAEIGQLAGVHRTDWSWAPLFADFDNDGKQDLYITNGYGKDVTDLDFVKFRSDVMSPFASSGKLSAIIRDSLKQRPSLSLPDFIFQNKGSYKFDNQSAQWGITQSSISSGAAYADLDNDGDLDMVVSNLNESPFTYRNQSMETDSASSNFLRVKLIGPKNNTHGLGARISIFTNENQQHRDVQVVRGFQSSVENIVHFGLSTDTTIDSLIVLWPDGKESKQLDVPTNQLVKIDYTNASDKNETQKKTETFFSSTDNPNVSHHENNYNDFAVQPLLLNGCSSEGPAIAVGDVNGDGLDDFFVGGAYQSNASLMIQTSDGEFLERVLDTKEFEDLGAIFFDADGDDDLDLYVASGGTERYSGHHSYKDRLYLNDGRGGFTMASDALPEIYTSTSTVAASDFDNDGDTDLFIGGRVIPGRYPETPSSYLLSNSKGKFTDVTSSFAPALANLGMVTSALWTDFNNDHKPDLMVVGEFMRLSVFKGTGNRLVDITDETSLRESYGLWSSIQSADTDNDGDMDYIAGNRGMNNAFTISRDHPLELFYADYDNNGSIDPIFSAFEQDNFFPVSSLDQLTKQVPFIKKQILHYRTYAATDSKKLRALLATPSSHLTCKMAESVHIENLGNGDFMITPLPIEAQVAPVNGIAAEDVNLDGLADLILVGNKYQTEVVNGRYDASAGTVLINQGGNQFAAVAPEQTGFAVQGESRGVVRLEMKDKTVLLTARNNASVVSSVINSYVGLKKINIPQDVAYALLFLGNGKQQKIEFAAGCGYLSQSSRSIVLTRDLSKVDLYNSQGSNIKTIQLNNFSVPDQNRNKLSALNRNRNKRIKINPI